MRGRPSNALVGAVVFIVATAVLPRHLAGVGAEGMYEGTLAAQKPLADGVASWAKESAGADLRITGSDLFDAEWRFVSCQMTVLGLGQVVHQHPSTTDSYLPAMEACLTWMVTPRALAFGADKWGEAGIPVERLSPWAYLGYLNVALSMHRLLMPDSRFAALNDRLTERLKRKLVDSKPWELQTYPGETYPADISTVVGSIGLHGLATGRNYDYLQPWLKEFRQSAVDAETGLAVQSLSPTSGDVVDGPRASGTAFVAYFLSFVDMQTSAELWAALRERQFGTTLGFGGIDEFPDGLAGGFGDVDSGPVLLGVGTSATGFSIASARVHGNRDAFVALVRTANLFGAPRERDGQQRYLMGGSIGNALLLTMLTAHPIPAP